MQPFHSPADEPEVDDLRRRPYTYEPAPRIDWRRIGRSALILTLGFLTAVVVGVYGYAVLLTVAAVMWLAGPFYVARVEGDSYRPAWLLLGMSAFGAGLILVSVFWWSL